MATHGAIPGRFNALWSGIGCLQQLLHFIYTANDLSLATGFHVGIRTFYPFAIYSHNDFIIAGLLGNQIICIVEEEKNCGSFFHSCWVNDGSSKIFYKV